MAEVTGTGTLVWALQFEPVSEAEESADIGVTFAKPKIDVDKVRAWKDEVVGKLTGGLAGLAKRRKVEVVAGTGRFTSERTLAVETADAIEVRAGGSVVHRRDHGGHVWGASGGHIAANTGTGLTVQTWECAAAIDYAVAGGADVVNNSWGNFSVHGWVQY